MLDFKKTEEEVVANLLPPNSKAVYETEIQHYVDFLLVNELNPAELAESNVPLGYFFKLKDKYSPATLWKKYSIINTYHKNTFNVNLKSYCPKLVVFLSRLQKDHPKAQKKAHTFEKEDYERFLQNAPDEGKYLLYKTAMSIGVYGGLRVGAELKKIIETDVIKKEDGYMVYYTPAKSGKAVTIKHWFLIPRLENQSICPAVVLDKYIALVRKTEEKQFLKNWNWKCSNFIQRMGINNVMSVGKEIAKYLGLPEPDKYTSHCFRKTAATLAADSGATTQDLMKHFRWKNENMAQVYVNHSKASKTKAAELIAGAPLKIQKVKEEEEEDRSLVPRSAISQQEAKDEQPRSEISEKESSDRKTINFYFSFN